MKGSLGSAVIFGVGLVVGVAIGGWVLDRAKSILTR